MQYNDKGDLKFEGNYLNGIRISGKLYSINSNYFSDLEHSTI